MKILLTGATGFIGSGLWKMLLDRGHDVIGLSRHPPDGHLVGTAFHHVRYAMGEALPDGVVKFSPKILVHLAWNGIPDFSARVCADNVASQMRFLGETEKLKDLRKVLVAGSCKEYGDKSGICREAEKAVADDYFSWAKQTLFEYFRLNCRQREISLLWFRLFYVFGPGQRSGTLVPSLIEAYRAGLTPEIRNPSAAHDFVYIDDVLEAFVMGIENEESAGVLNLGSGHLTSVPDVAQTVAGLLNDEVDRSNKDALHLDKARRHSGLVADISRAKLVLGWEPRTTLSEGIEKAWKVPG